MTTQAHEEPRSTRTLVRWQRVVLYAVLIAFAIFYLIPVYVLIVTGMKSFAEVNLYRMWDLPSGLHFDSYAKAWFGSEAEGFRGLKKVSDNSNSFIPTVANLT